MACSSISLLLKFNDQLISYPLFLEEGVFYTVSGNGYIEQSDRPLPLTASHLISPKENGLIKLFKNEEQFFSI